MIDIDKWLENLAKSADEAIIAMGNLQKDVIEIYEKLDKAEEMLKEMREIEIDRKRVQSESCDKPL